MAAATTWQVTVYHILQVADIRSAIVLGKGMRRDIQDDGLQWSRDTPPQWVSSPATAFQ